MAGIKVSNVELPDGDQILTPDQVAHLLRITKRKLMREPSMRNELRPFRVGYAVRYWMSDVTAYLKRQTEAAEAANSRLARRHLAAARAPMQRRRGD